jgi:uncharacterized protein
MKLINSSTTIRNTSTVNEANSIWTFRPAIFLNGGHLQTIAGLFSSTRISSEFNFAESREIDVANDVKVIIRCNWQPQRESCPTLVLIHGLEGSDRANYILSIATKAFDAGWNIVRHNLRGLGGGMDLSKTFYHAGLSGDVATVVNHLIEIEGLKRIHLIGFSIGANMLLKLLGEYGITPPSAVCSAVAISPCIDLEAANALLATLPSTPYRMYFTRRVFRRAQKLCQLYPDALDLEAIRRVNNLDLFTYLVFAKPHGFRSIEDYYQNASAISSLAENRVPTLVIHSDDDPVAPLTARVRIVLETCRSICLVSTSTGGHVGFVGIRSNDEDSHWAENRAFEFLQVQDPASWVETRNRK